MTTIATADAAAPTATSPLSRRATLWLLGTLLAVTAAVFGLAVLAITLIPGGREHAVTLVALTLPVHTLAVLLVLHVGLHRGGTGWRALGLDRPGRRLAHLLWQIPALLLGALATQAAVAAVLQRSPTPDGGGLGVLGDASLPLVLLALMCAVIAVPIWEEAVFRGLIFGGVRRHWGTAFSTLVSAGAFALAHGVPLLLPYLLVVGIGLALIYVFHRTLWAPVIAHGTINLIASTAIVSALFG